MLVLCIVDLVLDNLPKVLDLVLDISHKWYELGLQLGVKERDLKVIEHDYGDRAHGAQTCLREVLSAWLKMIDPPPSWERLLSSVGHSTVGNPALTQEIRQKVDIKAEDVPTRPSKHTGKFKTISSLAMHKEDCFGDCKPVVGPLVI
jgi:hypothetical protein